MRYQAALHPDRAGERTIGEGERQGNDPFAPVFQAKH